MTLEQIYALSPTIAALALVLSLIYASLQFRINTKVARNARLIAAAAVFQDFSRLLVATPNAREYLVTASTTWPNCARTQQDVCIHHGCRRGGNFWCR